MIVHARLDDLQDLELAGGEAVFAGGRVGEFAYFAGGGRFFAHGYRVAQEMKKIKHMFENNLRHVSVMGFNCPCSNKRSNTFPKVVPAGENHEHHFT